MPLLIEKEIYNLSTFEKEDVFEHAVIQLSDYIFGPQTIYIDIKKG